MNLVKSLHNRDPDVIQTQGVETCKVASESETKNGSPCEEEHMQWGRLVKVPVHICRSS
jgi:hypothetical protein